jgi:hypothetical protein
MPRAARGLSALAALLFCLAAAADDAATAGADRTNDAVRGSPPTTGHARAVFLFIAGLEGTGHHWYASLFEQCGKARCRHTNVGSLAWQRSAARFRSKMAGDEIARNLSRHEVRQTAPLRLLAPFSRW